MARIVLIPVIAASTIAGPTDGPKPGPVATLAIAAPASPINIAPKKSWLGMHRNKLIALLVLVLVRSLPWLASLGIDGAIPPGQGSARCGSSAPTSPSA
jgi:hypothetical protein